MFKPAAPRADRRHDGAQQQFKGLELGQRIELRGTDWTIVGVFESGGDSHESELLADGETVLSAYRRNLYQSVSCSSSPPGASMPSRRR